MSKRTVLTDIVDSLYEAAGVVAETATTIGQAVDKATLAVQDGLDHLIDVYPEYFSSKEATVHVEDEIKDFADSAVKDREYKMKYIQERMRLRNGLAGTIWETNPESINDDVVDTVYKMWTQRPVVR